ncbi:MAG: EAL domain-containing protein, partial [Clostridiales bacterium]
MKKHMKKHTKNHIKHTKNHVKNHMGSPLALLHNGGFVIFEYLNDLIKCTYANDGLYYLLDDDRANGRSFLADGLINAMHSDDIAGLYGQIKVILKNFENEIKEKHFYEYTCRILNGSSQYQWVKLRMRLIAAHNDAYIFYGTYSSMENEMQIQTELELSRQSLTVAIGNSGMYYCEYDLDDDKDDDLQYCVTCRKQCLSNVKANCQQTWFPLVNILPQYLEIYQQMHRDLKKGAKTVTHDIEIWLPQKQKSAWFRVKYTNIFDANGKPLKAIGTAKNLDSYKALEQTFFAVMAQTNIVTWTFDLPTHTIIQDKNTAAYFGYTKQLTIKNAPYSLVEIGIFHPEDEEKFIALHDSLYAGTPETFVDIRWKKKDQEEYSWIRIIYTAIYDKRGNAIRAFGISRDITAEKEAEQLKDEAIAAKYAAEDEKERLRIREEQYRIVAAQSGKYVLHYDIPTKIVYQDFDSHSLLGAPRVFENVPDSIREDGFVSPESIEDCFAFFNNILNGEKSGSVQIRIVSNDGLPIWYKGDFTTIFDQSGKPLQSIISFYDISQQREWQIAAQLYRQNITSLPPEKIMYYEYNLTRDTFEHEEGLLMERISDLAKANWSDYVEYANQKFTYSEDLEKYAVFFSSERLLALFMDGIREDRFEYRVKRDHYIKWIKVIVRLLADPVTGDIKAFLLFTDIDQKKREEIAIIESSKVDALTGALNRSAFVAGVEKLLNDAQFSQDVHAFIMIDVDNFKMINDTRGHGYGDEMLVEIYRRIRSVLRFSDLIGRMGGDEFMICLKDVGDLQKALGIAEVICNTLNVSDNTVSCPVSMGLAVYPDHGLDFESLYKKSDFALYAAKAQGKGCCVLYDSRIDISGIVPQNTPIEDELDGLPYLGLQNNGFYLPYQVLMEHMTGAVMLFELAEKLVIRYISPSFFRMTGYDRSMFLDDGETLFKTLLPEDFAQLNKTLHEGVEKATTVECTIRVIEENNSKHWRHIRAAQIPYSDNGNPLMIANITDVTEIKEKEIEMTLSLAQLDYIFHMSAMEIFDLDIQKHTVLFSNSTMSRYPMANKFMENVPESIIESGIIHPDSIADTLAFYKDVFAGKQQNSAILRIKKITGEYCLVRLYCRCLLDDEGKPFKAIGVSEEMKHIADYRLRFEQEQKLRNLISCDLIVYAIINLTGNTVEHLETFNFAEQEMASISSYTQLFDLLSTGLQNQEEYIVFRQTYMLKNFLQSYNHDHDWYYDEYHLTLADGTIQWASFAAQLLISPSNGNIYAFIYVRNVDDRKKHERDLSFMPKFDSTKTYYLASTLKEVANTAIRSNPNPHTLYGLAIIKVANLDEVVKMIGTACIDRLMLSLNRKLRFSMNNRHLTARTADNNIIIFLEDIESQDWLQNLGDYIIGIFYNPSFYTTVAEQYCAYQSGGVLLPASSGDFERMYQLALTAMEQADSLKPKIVCYGSGDTVHGKPIELIQQQGAFSIYDALHTADQRTVDIFIQATEIIFTEKDINAIANRILELVCSFYKADRAYVLEVDDESKTISNSFEWCAEDESSQIARLQNIALADVPTFDQAYTTGRSIYIHDINSIVMNQDEYLILKEQDIFSLYVIPYISENTVFGFVGIDNPSRQKENTSVLCTLTYFLMSEISKYRSRQRQVYLSRYDLLTGLLSRNSYVEYIAKTKLISLSSMGMLMADVNGLKDINSKYGNYFGDDILCQAAHILQEQFGKDSVYRYGGGTMLVLVADISQREFIERAEDSRRFFDQAVHYDMAMGYTWTDMPESIDKLLVDVNYLMDASKIERHSLAKGRKQLQHDIILADIIETIEKNNVLVYLQPKMNVITGKICGAEALVRIRDGEKIIYPNRFVPILEDAGLIRYIDFCVLEKVFSLLADWKEKGWPLLPLSLNFSRATIVEPNIVESISQISDKYDIPRSLVEIEITESLGDLEWEAIQRIGAGILAAGFRFALDDFGTQYSNLAILTSINFSTIKLDKSLVDRIVSNDRVRLLLESIIQLCKRYGFDVVAEGVETEAQFAVLEELGCEYIQGYLINKPIPISNFNELYILPKLEDI